MTNHPNGSLYSNLANGVVRSFNGPASQAFLPLVVPEDVFPNAVAWGSSVFQGSQILGPMVGGLVYGITGSPAPVYAAAAFAAIAAMGLMGALRVSPQTAAASGHSGVFAKAEDDRAPRD